MICHFDKTTFVGLFGNISTPPASNAFAVDIDPAIMGDFLNTPSRYQYRFGQFSERPGWAVEKPIVAWVEAQSKQLSIIDEAFASAITGDIVFTTEAGVTKAYQADPESRMNLHDLLARYQNLGSVPTGFYWVSSDNTQVPFTLTDLHGLFATGIDAGWMAFQHKQAQKTAIRNIIDTSPDGIAAIQAISW